MRTKRNGKQILTAKEDIGTPESEAPETQGEGAGRNCCVYTAAGRRRSFPHLSSGVFPAVSRDLTMRKAVCVVFSFPGGWTKYILVLLRLCNASDFIASFILCA